MNYNYDYDRNENKPKKSLTALIAVLIVLLIANIIVLSIISTSLKKQIDLTLDNSLTDMEDQLDDKIDDALANRLTTTISEQVADNILNDVTSQAVELVSNEVTQEVIENYKRDYNLPENYFGIGIKVAQERINSVLELSASGHLNVPYDNQTETSQSTGIILNNEGYILTNAHCVTFEATIYEYINQFWGYQARGTETKVYESIEGNFKGSLTKYKLNVVAYDVEKDLAIIKFDNVPENLEPVVIGDSDLVNIGEEVAAIGNAQGLGISLTTGVVSDSAEQYNDVKVIQTDTTINPGNSGGPLFNIYSELIGINSFKIIENELNEGLGFAIASNSVVEYIESVKSAQGITINYTLAQ